jgi:uncharacterized membrane protein YdjX (TVP38/TMEM64 family)
LPDATPTHPEETAARAGWGRWAGVALAVVVLAVVAPRLGEALPRLFAWVEGLGAWGPIAYIALYVLATVLVVPGALVTLAGGAIFGLAEGTAWVFVGAVIGSGLAFLIGRYLARDAVATRISRFERFAAVDRAVGRDGLRMVFLLRLSPIFPFSLLNYALGLTAVRFRDYMLAAVCMLPGTLLYVYYGKVAGDLAQLASGVPQERGLVEWAMLLVGLGATLAVTVVVTRRARAALSELDDERVEDGDVVDAAR